MIPILQKQNQICIYTKHIFKRKQLMMRICDFNFLLFSFLHVKTMNVHCVYNQKAQ